MMSACPIGSGRRGRAARDSGTKRAVSAMAARPTGMFTQNVPRQPMESTSSPPTTGPSAMDRPYPPPQTPIARARSVLSVNVLVMIDIATGLSMDPPMACSMRKATSQPRPGARLHRPEPAVKVARPIRKTRRRPTRSAVAPDSIRKLARTRA